MNNIILIVQIIISLALSVSILLQSRGAGLGSAFGESSEQYRSKRGVEKLLYRSTIILVILFLLSSLGNVLIK